jgi:hypothetical protein
MRDAPCRNEKAAAGAQLPELESALAGLLAGDLRPFLARFGKADGNGLFAAFYLSTFATFARFQRPLLLAMHCALYAFPCRFPVLCHEASPPFGFEL